MRWYRRSRLKSSRGHVRVEQGPPWGRWGMWIGAAAILILVLVALISQIVEPALKKDKKPSGNRTWLEFAWTNEPVNQDAVRDLARRLQDNGIDRVYLEAAAWRTDGTLLEGQSAAQFVQALRAAYPKIQVLLWLRMSGDEIAQPARQAAATGLAQKAVQQWTFDGAQLNGRAVPNGSESFVTLVRGLRSAMGGKALLSVTVPPDRIPTDPDVPIGPNAEPGLTWDINYKQRVTLLQIDEIVVMAHASGLSNSTDYQTWVAYQVQSYADALAELDQPAALIVALPTYDAAPEHDPSVEDMRSAVQGVKNGIKRAGKNGHLVTGVGLYEYKTTDSLEWALFRQYWLGLKP